MKYEMIMPDLATTGSAIKLLGWKKQPGEVVTRGEILFEIETDKAAMEVEATVDGRLLETRFPPGAEVITGDVVAVLEIAGNPSAPGNPPARPPGTPASTSTPVGATPPKLGGMFARNRAAAESGKTPDPRGAGVALSPARKTAARRLQESKQTVPHFYLQSSAHAGAMVARRNAALPEKLLWDAFFVKAVAQAIKRYDRMAFRFADDQLVPLEASSIGVAADLDGDLFVIQVDCPATKGIEQISRDIRTTLDELRQGSPEVRRNKPGLMTISNLGGTGVESFAAIINPPEAAILAIGRIGPVVRPRESGYTTEQRVSLTLSVDHRVVNGKYAAEFLSAIVQEIENL